MKRNLHLFGGRFIWFMAVCVSFMGMHAWQEADAASGLFWDFENGPEEWQCDPIEPRISHVRAASGSQSLAVTVRFPQDSTVQVALKDGFAANGELSFDVYCPKSAPRDIRALVFWKDKDGSWFQSGIETAFKPGEWSHVALEFSTSSFNVQALEHDVQWNAYAASRMRTFGIKFFSRSRFNGEVLLDHVRFRSNKVADKLSILAFEAHNPEVGRYDIFTCSFQLNRGFDNPFDPDEVSVYGEFISPSGRVVQQNGFYFQDYQRSFDTGHERLMPIGRPQWRIRFAPEEPGEYTYRITVSCPDARITTGPLSFICTPSDRRGFIRISPEDSQYLEFDNGEWFFPIGQNIHTSTDPRGAEVMGIPFPEDDGTYAYDKLMTTMAAHGENILEVWMSSWWMGLEWSAEQKNYNGLGYYNLAHAWKLDYMMSLADQLGMYFHLVIDNHGKLTPRSDQEWAFNPYNQKNGGMLIDSISFFSNARAKEYYKQKLRYIMARWGAYPQIMGFEFWSEVNLSGGPGRRGRTQDQTQWHIEMADHAKLLDPWKHLVTTHYSGSYNTINVDLMKQPEMDYLAFNAYCPPGDLIPLLRRSSVGTSYMRKPSLVTEYGGMWYGATMGELEACVHSGLWAAFMTNLAGGPLIWWTDFVEKYHAYDHYLAFANYVAGEDKRGRALKTSKASLGSGKKADLRSMVLANHRMLYAWVYSDSAMTSIPEEPKEIPKGTSFTYTGLEAGDYKVEYWDTYKGCITSQEEVTVNKKQRLTLRLPAFQNDLALKVKRIIDSLPPR